MKKFFAFCSKFAGIILLIIGIVAAILWALQSGLAITKAGAWGHPDLDVKSTIGFSISVGGLAMITVFGFLAIFIKRIKWLANFGKFIIMAISIALVLGLVIQSGIWLSDHSWTKFETTEAKATIGIFSVGLILLTMNIVFGIFSIGYKKGAKAA